MTLDHFLPRDFSYNGGIMDSRLLNLESPLAGAFLATAAFCQDQADLIWPTIEHLELTYPGFRTWFYGKVVPGLRTGERSILIKGAISDPSGIAITKRDPHETKVCTLWVADAYRQSGLGRDLLEEAIDWCDYAQPLFTVPAEQIASFAGLVERFSFVETARIRSLYRPGVVEHIFNGSIVPTHRS